MPAHLMKTHCIPIAALTAATLICPALLFSSDAPTTAVAPVLQPFVDPHHATGAAVLVADSKNAHTAEAVSEGQASHNGVWKFNMTVDSEAGLITILMAQVAGWRNDAEGKEIEPVFSQAALAAFSKSSAPSRNP